MKEIELKVTYVCDLCGRRSSTEYKTASTTRPEVNQLPEGWRIGYNKVVHLCDVCSKKYFSNLTLERVAARLEALCSKQEECETCIMFHEPQGNNNCYLHAYPSKPAGKDKWAKAIELLEGNSLTGEANALRDIREYCSGLDCKDCRFSDAEKYCKFNDMPQCWNVDRLISSTDPYDIKPDIEKLMRYCKMQIGCGDCDMYLGSEHLYPQCRLRYRPNSTDEWNEAIQKLKEEGWLSTAKCAAKIKEFCNAMSNCEECPYLIVADPSGRKHCGFILSAPQNWEFNV